MRGSRQASGHVPPPRSGSYCSLHPGAESPGPGLSPWCHPPRETRRSLQADVIKWREVALDKARDRLPGRIGPVMSTVICPTSLVEVSWLAGGSGGRCLNPFAVAEPTQIVLGTSWVGQCPAKVRRAPSRKLIRGKVPKDRLRIQRKGNRAGLKEPLQISPGLCLNKEPSSAIAPNANLASIEVSFRHLIRCFAPSRQAHRSQLSR